MDAGGIAGKFANEEGNGLERPTEAEFPPIKWGTNLELKSSFQDDPAKGCWGCGAAFVLSVRVTRRLVTTSATSGRS
jgi:hypothetical protein